MNLDQYAILAQIMRWADILDHQAESMNDPAIETAKDMRTFVKANIELAITAREYLMNERKL